MTMLKSCLLLFMIFSMGEVTAKSCLSGWTNYGLLCYKYFYHPVDWITAEKTCQILGGNLASVHSYAQKNFLLSMIPFHRGCWIGGHDSQHEGHWLWSDGSEFYYTYWCSGEPNDYWRGENCLEFNPYRCWNDVGCGKLRTFICAMKP